MYFDSTRKKIFLHEDNGVVIEEENSIKIGGETFFLKYILKDGRPIRGGGNSSVFILYDKNGIEQERVIKFSNYSKPNRFSNDWIKRRHGRFITEIECLKLVSSSSLQSNIVSLFDDGVENISEKDFPYYTMEKADNTLKDYLLDNNENLDFIERVKLFRDVYYGVKTLHSLDFYHRDIKPDNILLFYTEEADDNDGRKFTWKIGDLGLLAHRDKDYDDIGEKIGPVGWLSPEAMNKFLTEEYELGLDCSITEDSDIFQLGKLLWFIFQYNVPIGQIKFEDFTYAFPNKKFVFQLIEGMLQHTKERRIKNQTITDMVEILSMEFGI